MNYQTLEKEDGCALGVSCKLIDYLPLKEIGQVNMPVRVE